MDQSLRRQQRTAMAEGGDARLRLVMERLRAGELDHDLVSFAAHIGHPLASQIGLTSPLIACNTCEQQSGRAALPVVWGASTQTHRYPPQDSTKPCATCNDRGEVALPNDLIKSVTRYPLPIPLTVCWAADCVEMLCAESNPLAADVLKHLSTWARDETVDPQLQQFANETRHWRVSDHSGLVIAGDQLQAAARLVQVMSQTRPLVQRRICADVASYCYRRRGYKRWYRDWQIECLGDRLLGLIE